MKSKYTIEEVQSFKISDCYGSPMALLYYLNRNFGVKQLYDVNDLSSGVTHIVLTNRVFLDVYNNPLLGNLVDKKGHFKLKDMEKIVRTPGIKTSCFSHYKGDDQVSVYRNGVKLSSIRKLEK